MIHRFIILLSLIVGLAACQQDDNVIIGDNDDANEKAFPVNVSFSLDDVIGQSTSYEPMTRSAQDADEVVVMVSNRYNAIFIKEIGDSLVIHDIVIGIADKNQSAWGFASFKRGESFSDLDLELTPGKYHLVVFTGINSVKWNDHIKRGGIIKDETHTPEDRYACTYNLGSSSYSNVGLKTLPEEILTGRTEFTVTKTGDLHSSPDPALSSLHINLKRNVTKFRIALHYLESETKDNFDPTTPPIIKGYMRAVNGTKFLDGLNIWGEPWYDPVTPLTEMPYCTEGVELVTGLDNEQYLISYNGARVHSPYFFTEEGTDVEVELYNVTAQGQSGMRIFRYNEAVIPVTLKHNNIDGVSFRPGTITDNDLYPVETNMILETVGGVPVNTLNIFGSYFEFNPIH